MSDRICNHPRAFGLSPNPRGRHAKRQADPLRVDWPRDGQTKVSEWKRGWCFASDRRRIPVADATAFAASLATTLMVSIVVFQAGDGTHAACPAAEFDGDDDMVRLELDPWE